MLEYQKENQNGLPTLDPTTPWYEFLSYQECCRSLGVPVRLQSFMRYHAYLKQTGVIK